MKIKSIAKFFVTCAVCATFTACDSESDIEKKPGSSVLAQKTYPEPSGEYNSWTEISLDAESAASAVNANKFAFNIFRTATISSSGDDNMAISPLSILTSLSMLANGDDGESRDDVLGLLGYDGGSDNLSKLNRFAGIMLSELPKVDGRTMCRFTNSIWHSPGLKLHAGFRDVLTKTYDSEDIPISPAGISGMDSINKWVNRYTEGNIRQFMKKPAENDMAVVNAVHFYSKWTTKFNKEKTREQNFRNIDNSISTVPTMHGKYPRTSYVDNGEMEMVSMSLGNSNFQMLAILPDIDRDFNEFVKSFSFSKFNNALNNMETKTIELAFPKFMSKGEMNLLETLKSSGLDKAAYNGFNSMTDSKTVFNITGMLHAVNVTVDEDGVVASAATSTSFGTSAGDISEPIPMTFNRPFIYLIRETSTGTILFIGKVTKL